MQGKTNFLLVCLLVTFSILIGGCRKNEESNCTGVFPVQVKMECDNSTQGQDELRRDAMRLSIPWYTQNETLPPSAFIPETAWMPFFKALVAVRAAIPQIECEDLTSLLEIEILHSNSTGQLLIEVDSTYSWTDAWRNGNSQTGNPAIDSLMDAYQLSLSDHHLSSYAQYAILDSEEPLNLSRLSLDFAGIDGVRYAEPNYLIGGRDRVEADYDGDDLLLEFSKGYGDCPSGCINRDTWTFRVDENCTVLYESFESR